jgi:hypothetical protein
MEAAGTDLYPGLEPFTGVPTGSFVMVQTLPGMVNPNAAKDVAFRIVRHGTIVCHVGLAAMQWNGSYHDCHYYGCVPTLIVWVKGAHKMTRARKLMKRALGQITVVDSCVQRFRLRDLVRSGD